MLSPGTLSLALLVTIAAGATTALLAWHERGEPGARPLVLMLVGQCWWSVSLFFQLRATSLSTKAFWVDLSWVGVVAIPLAWLLFALEYTGRDNLVKPRYVAVLAVVPVVTVVLALTGRSHDLLYLDARLVEQGGYTMLVRTAGPWYWVAAGYTYLLGALGMLPIWGLVRSEAAPFRGQSAALLVGTLTPWLINAFHLSGTLPLGALDPTPIGFAISGIAYFGAIRRFRLFETNPAPNRNAGRLVFERMPEGAVVVDTNDNVVDMNQNASSVLGVDTFEVLGESAPDVIPKYDHIPEEGATPEHLTIDTESGTGYYDVSVTRIDNSRGHAIGRVVVFHDVSEHRRQQQRLDVLNRVLRHNIRTETNLIWGYADRMDDADVDDQLKHHTLRIEEMATKARKIAEMFAEEDGTTPISLEASLSRSITAVEAEFPDVEVDQPTVEEDVAVASVLEHVFSNVVHNAAAHNPGPDAHVDVSVEADGDVVRVVVADDGPGIEEIERAVLDSDTETQLDHGSGLGLWLVRWGVDIAGGRIEFADADPTGTVVTVEVPVQARADEVPTAERASI